MVVFLESSSEKTIARFTPPRSVTLAIIDDDFETGTNDTPMRYERVFGPWRELGVEYFAPKFIPMRFRDHTHNTMEKVILGVRDADFVFIDNALLTPITGLHGPEVARAIAMHYGEGVKCLISAGTHELPVSQNQYFISVGPNGETFFPIKRSNYFGESQVNLLVGIMNEVLRSSIL